MIFPLFLLFIQAFSSTRRGKCFFLVDGVFFDLTAIPANNQIELQGFGKIFFSVCSNAMISCSKPARVSAFLKNGVCINYAAPDSDLLTLVKASEKDVQLQSKSKEIHVPSSLPYTTALTIVCNTNIRKRDFKVIFTETLEEERIIHIIALSSQTCPNNIYKSAFILLKEYSTVMCCFLVFIGTYCILFSGKHPKFEAMIGFETLIQFWVTYLIWPMFADKNELEAAKFILFELCLVLIAAPMSFLFTKYPHVTFGLFIGLFLLGLWKLISAFLVWIGLTVIEWINPLVGALFFVLGINLGCKYSTKIRLISIYLSGWLLVHEGLQIYYKTFSIAQMELAWRGEYEQVVDIFDWKFYVCDGVALFLFLSRVALIFVSETKESLIDIDDMTIPGRISMITESEVPLN